MKRYSITHRRQDGGARFFQVFIHRPWASGIPMGTGAGSTLEEALRSALAEVRERRARGELEPPVPIVFRRYYSDTGPDALGRRRFTLLWEDPRGVFRPEIHFDGQPVGYRRGQCFHAVPAEQDRQTQRDGHRIVEPGGPCPDVAPKKRRA